MKQRAQYIKTRIDSFFWQPHTRLFIKGDHANWSLYWDAVELSRICGMIGIPVIDSKYKRLMKNQCFFNMSRDEFLKNWQKPKGRIAFPYYHGNPSTDERSRQMLKTISRHHADIARIQVSCRFMEEIVLETGIDRTKVFRIPIGINRNYFRKTTPELKRSVRGQLGIPEHAVVIGSFQKDGNGMKEGLEPKLIKGPDIFLKSLEILKPDFPELFVLLTGPARGYVMKGLDKIGIPYAHHYLSDYTEIGKFFNAIDAYIISSRDEGGPKAVLESMASGIPLVSTKVGQAADLINHGKNGYLVDVEDAEAIAHFTGKLLRSEELKSTFAMNGLITAAENDYENQLPQWTAFMRGFVEQ